MIFVETRQEARDLALLEFANFLPIHGEMEQRAREKALDLFKNSGSKHILVGTDVASRGLDIDDVDIIIQLSCKDYDSYLHRSGRTARKGKKGLNILFFT